MDTLDQYQGKRVELVHIGPFKKILLEPGALPEPDANQVMAIFDKVDRLIEAGIQVVPIKDIEETDGIFACTSVILGGAATDICVADRREFLLSLGVEVFVDES